MNTLEEIYGQSGLQTDYFKKYSEYLQKLLSEITRSLFIVSISLFAQCLIRHYQTSPRGGDLPNG